MKVYISTDLEGVCGVFRFEQSRDDGSPANIEARRLLMGEVNAALSGVIILKDCAMLNTLRR